MTFIATISENDAEGATRALYDQAKARFGYLPNMARAFGHCPQVWQAWSGLLDSIRSRMTPRRYELVTLAAAQELRSSYCMLAHGSVLLRDFFDAEELESIVNTHDCACLDETEKAIVGFSRQVVRDASSVSQSDIDALKKAGLTDSEIFDVASAAAARCFFSKTLDAVGTRPDSAYRELDDGLQKTLTVGRPIE